MKLTCAIVDDEPLARELVKSYVDKTDSLELVGCYGSAIEALQKQDNQKPIQLLFLDIQMPELNGLEYSQMVSPETRIVFTTAFDRYAIDSYKVHALDYLLKPISYTEFLKSVNKAIEWFELKEKAVTDSTEQPANDAKFIYVKSDYKLVQIELERILYIEGLKDYVKIYLEGEEKAILSLISMKNMEERLPATRFIRVHRSFIVQKEKIKVVERGRIVFGKEYIPISDSYKNDLLLYLNNHSV
ncbi:MAG: LytR/AlgR family response regulator transcription factor [Phocaeicola sp.]